MSLPCKKKKVFLTPERDIVSRPSGRVGSSGEHSALPQAPRDGQICPLPPYTPHSLPPPFSPLEILFHSFPKNPSLSITNVELLENSVAPWDRV